MPAMGEGTPSPIKFPRYPELTEQGIRAALACAADRQRRVLLAMP
jgi:uncharacterized protein (DUF433 family)